VDRDNAGHRGYGLHAGLDVVDGHVVDAVHQACGGRVGPKAMAGPCGQALHRGLHRDGVGMRFAERLGKTRSRLQPSA